MCVCVCRREKQILKMALWHRERTGWQGEKGCDVPPGFFPALRKRQWRARHRGLVGSSWECWGNEGRWCDGVTRLSVREKATVRWDERGDGMWACLGGEKRALNIEAQAEVLTKRCRLEDARLYLHIFFFAYLIPCQRMHHPATDEQNSW